MLLKPEDYVGSKDFLRLDYPCAIPFSGSTFSSLEQALIAVLCDDTVIWQIITSTDDLADAYSMLPEILNKRVSHHDYVERLITLTTEKFSQQDIYDKLMFETSDEDTFTYEFKYGGPQAWEIENIMRPYYEIMGQIVTMYRQGTTNGLYISEAILGEL